jgi:hypothetical protein
MAIPLSGRVPGKSFWTLPIFGSTAAADRDVF